MSRTARILAALALAGAAVPLVGVVPAHAETSTETASNGAYFYSAGIDKPDESPAPPPNLTGDRTDGVAPGHLAAAVRVPNQEDKKSYLFFDLLDVGFEGSVQKAVVTVPLAEDGNGNVQMSPAPEKVQACPADATGFAGEDGASFKGAPATQCDVFAVKATANEDGTAYLFDVTAMAQAWVTENNGMAIVPADLSSPFQVVFKPFAEATIDLEYTPGADALSEGEIEPESFGDAAVDDFSSDVATDSGSFDSGSFDSGSVAAAESLGFAAADIPAIESELPQTATADEAAVPEPALAGDAPQTRAVAAFSESLSPTTGLLVGGLLLALLLAGLSLIMGDPQAPVTTAGAPSRLTQALQSRAGVRSLLSGPAPRP